MSELISMNAYAKRRGVSHEAVRKAVKTARITLINGKVDPEVADIQWARNTNTDQATRGNGGRLPAGYEAGAIAGMMLGGAESAAQRASGADIESAGDNPRFMDAKTRSEMARAELFELELATKRGALVNTSDIRRATFEKARIARDALMGLPSRLAPQLAAENDAAKIHDMITVEVRRICDELSRGEKQTQQ